MAITLAEAKATMDDKVDRAVIDEFRRESLLLDKLIFDNSVSPGTGGSTLTYGYTRLETPSTASSRKINSEYSTNEAKRKKCTAELKVFGGAFGVDRVIQDTSGSLNEMKFQLEEKIKAARNYFHYLVINGDSATNEDEFDGLDAILTGTSTEFNDARGFDLSTSGMIDTNYKSFLDILDNFLSGLDGKPDMLLGNSQMVNRIQAVARRSGYMTRSEDSFGRSVTEYNGIAILDMGKFFNGSNTIDVVASYSAEVKGSTTTGLCDLYAVKFGLDAFHAASPSGNNIIKTYLPRMEDSGAVKRGEIELVAATVLKNSLKAGVMRGIKTM